MLGSFIDPVTGKPHRNDHICNQQCRNLAAIAKEEMEAPIYSANPVKWPENLRVQLIDSDAALMEMDEPYSTGDVRACGGRGCFHYVVYMGYDWRHIPIPGEDRMTAVGHWSTHVTRPFPEHKHKLKLNGVARYTYFYECRVCAFKFEYNRNMIRRMLLPGWKG